MKSIFQTKANAEPKSAVVLAALPATTPSAAIHFDEALGGTGLPVMTSYTEL